MKKINVEIEAREAVETHRYLNGLLKYLENNGKKTENFHLMMGVLQNLDDKISNGLKSQLTIEELKEATAHRIDHDEAK